MISTSIFTDVADSPHLNRTLSHLLLLSQLSPLAYRPQSPKLLYLGQGNSVPSLGRISALPSLQRHAARTEDASMTRTVAIPAKKEQSFAHKALKALGFVNLKLFFKHPHSAPVIPATPHSARQEAPGHLQMSIEDWDIMFRSIQLRLRATVGERLESAPAPQADDRAGSIQVAVLDCVAAMELLHTALTHERTTCKW